GRQAIEKNTGAIIATSTTIFRNNIWIHCQITRHQPRFLSSPMTVIATKYESEGVGVYSDNHKIYAYRPFSDGTHHTHCVAAPLQGSFGRAFYSTVEATYSELVKIEADPRPMSGH